MLFATIFFSACNNEPVQVEQAQVQDDAKQQNETDLQTANSTVVEDTVVLLNTDSLIEKITDEKSWQAARSAAYHNRQLLRSIAYEKKQKDAWLAYHEKDSICQSIWRERTKNIQAALEILKVQSGPAYDMFISTASKHEDALSWLTLSNILDELEKTLAHSSEFMKFAQYCRNLNTAAMNEQDKIGRLMIQKQNVAGAEMLSVQTRADNEMINLQTKADQKWIAISRK